MEAGETPKEASRRGTGEVALPVLAMSLTIVSVFIPIAFVGGLVGKFMNSFGVGSERRGVDLPLRGDDLRAMLRLTCSSRRRSRRWSRPRSFTSPSAARWGGWIALTVASSVGPCATSW